MRTRLSPLSIAVLASSAMMGGLGMNVPSIAPPRPSKPEEDESPEEREARLSKEKADAHNMTFKRAFALEMEARRNENALLESIRDDYQMRRPRHSSRLTTYSDSPRKHKQHAEKKAARKARRKGQRNSKR